LQAIAEEENKYREAIIKYAKIEYENSLLPPSDQEPPDDLQAGHIQRINEQFPYQDTETIKVDLQREFKNQSRNPPKP
jgi:hypothetical protein